jgi:hypothetical protein
VIRTLSLSRPCLGRSAQLARGGFERLTPISDALKRAVDYDQIRDFGRHPANCAPRYLNVSRRKRGKSANADNAPCGSPFYEALFQLPKLTSKSRNT